MNSYRKGHDASCLKVPKDKKEGNRFPLTDQVEGMFRGNDREKCRNDREKCRNDRENCGMKDRDVGKTERSTGMTPVK